MSSFSPSSSFSASPVTFVPRHLSLPSLTSSSRVLFIGDVHGCYEELQDLLALSGVEVGVDAVVLTGDLIAKGPFPMEVLHFVRTTPNVLTVMGNHDHHVVQAMMRREGIPAPLLSFPTLPPPPPPPPPPYDQQPHEFVAEKLTGEEERRWMASLPLSISLPSLSPPHVVVHAGLVPGVALEDQQPFVLMNVRNITEDGRGIKGKKEGVNWVERWTGPEKVIFGHAASRGVQQVEGGMALGLDSGCCYGKQLTGWLLPEGRLLQVQARRMYERPDHTRGGAE
jgi:hypothetical protein